MNKIKEPLPVWRKRYASETPITLNFNKKKKNLISIRIKYLGLRK